MALFLSNRDGGLTNEEGHYRFHVKAWNGNVLAGFAAVQNSPLGMSVLVGEGDAKVNYSGYGYTVWNDANVSVTVTTADPSNPRIDRLVCYVDRGNTPQSVTPNNPGIPKFMLVPGSPAGVPTRPNNAAVNAAVGASNPWFDIADIRVNAAVTTISNSNITYTRVPASPVIPPGAITPSMRSGGFFKGTISGATFSTTGNKVITGVGFRPKYVKFTILQTSSSTVAQTGIGEMTADGTQSVSATYGTGSTHGRNSSTTSCIGWMSSASAFGMGASFVSMDDDGFTINVTTASAAFAITYTAFG